MRTYLLLVLILLLFAAACQDDNNVPDNQDGTTDELVQQPDAPRVEDTPVPTATPIPTAMPLPVRDVPDHVYVVPTRTIHIVQPGDTMTVISKHYGISVKALADSNRHYNFDLIRVGDVLYIPPCELPSSVDPIFRDVNHLIDYDDFEEIDD